MTPAEILKLADQLGKDLAAAQDENDRLRQWIADLQSSMYVNCVYCGHRYGPADKTPTSLAEILKRHIAGCSEHPMSGLIKTLNQIHHLTYQSGWLDSLMKIRELASTAVDKAEGRS